ncbi:MAG: amino acid permease [Bacteroidales bacterium]|nr:amino acid permease [Bacteroidales bacterium]
MAEDNLPRKLGHFSLTNIVIANMIGAGIFTISGLLLGQLHDPLLLLALWVVGGGIALCGALSYSELGANFPRAGGEYVFLSELFSPMAGFLSGWVSFIVGFSAPIAASSLAFSEYLIRTIPEGVSLDHIILYKKATAIGVILIFTLIHYFGLKSGSKVQNMLTMLKIALILVLVIAGFAFGEGSFQHFRIQLSDASETAGLKTIGLSLMWIMFAYSGWNAATYVGSEVLNPVRNIPRSLITGTLFVTLIYLLLNTLYVYAVPAAEMKDVISIGGLAANNMFNRTMDQFFSLFIAVILLSSISALIIIGPRVYFAMALSGHFFKMAKKVNRSNVPGTSILLQTGLAILFVVSGTFDQIITLLSFSLGIFPILAVLGVIKLRMNKQSILNIPGYPLCQLVFIFLSLSILVFAYMERPVESSIAILVILAGIPVYYLLKRSHTMKS